MIPLPISADIFDCTKRICPWESQMESVMSYNLGTDQHPQRALRWLVTLSRETGKASRNLLIPSFTEGVFLMLWQSVFPSSTSVTTWATLCCLSDTLWGWWCLPPPHILYFWPYVEGGCLHIQGVCANHARKDFVFFMTSFTNDVQQWILGPCHNRPQLPPLATSQCTCLQLWTWPKPIPILCSHLPKGKFKPSRQGTQTRHSQFTFGAHLGLLPTASPDLHDPSCHKVMIG